MKKNDIVITNIIIGSIKNLTQGENKKIDTEELKPFNYCFLRNELRFKPIIEEQQKIINFLAEEFKELENKEELNFNEYVNNSQKFKDFLEEETEIEFYTIKIDSLEGKEFNLFAAEQLLGILIIE